MSLFNGKTLMITGGTGSFGNAVLNCFLNMDIGEICISDKGSGNTLQLSSQSYRIKSKVHSI